jgi:hypothetical protein
MHMRTLHMHRHQPTHTHTHAHTHTHLCVVEEIEIPRKVEQVELDQGTRADARGGLCVRVYVRV